MPASMCDIKMSATVKLSVATYWRRSSHRSRPESKRFAQPTIASRCLRHPSSLYQVNHQNAHQWHFNRICSGETPTYYLRFANEVARDQFPRLLREINQNGGRLRQYHTIIIDNWDLLERTDPAVRVSVQLMRRMIPFPLVRTGSVFPQAPKESGDRGFCPGLPR